MIPPELEAEEGYKVEASLGNLEISYYLKKKPIFVKARNNPTVFA